MVCEWFSRVLIAVGYDKVPVMRCTAGAGCAAAAAVSGCRAVPWSRDSLALASTQDRELLLRTGVVVLVCSSCCSRADSAARGLAPGDPPSSTPPCTRPQFHEPPLGSLIILLSRQ